MEFIVVKRLTSICFVHWFVLGQRHPDYTRAVIKDKLNDTDNEIATTSCKVSLACPLGNVYLKLVWERHSKYYSNHSPRRGEGLQNTSQVGQDGYHEWRSHE